MLFCSEKFNLQFHSKSFILFCFKSLYLSYLDSLQRSGEAKYRQKERTLVFTPVLISRAVFLLVDHLLLVAN